MKRLFYYFLYLFVVWGSFRYFVRLPDVIEELWFKPVIWLTPLFWWSLSFRGANRIKMFEGNIFFSFLLGLGVGLFYFAMLRSFDFSDMVFTSSVVAIVIATAVTEEMTFSGFVVEYLSKTKNSRWLNLLIVSVASAILRLPILVFMYKVGVLEIFGVTMFVAGSAMINAWIRVYTKNVLGSVVARVAIGLATLV